jgi:hypothetical protein
MTRTRTSPLALLVLFGAAVLALAFLALPHLNLTLPSPAPAQANALPVPSDRSLSLQLSANLETLRGSLSLHVLPPLTEHAFLHEEAPYVHAWLNSHDTRGCRWEDCPDNRVKYFCNDGKHWLFAVVDEIANVTVTAFFTDQGYGIGATRDAGCHNPFRLTHP